MPGAPAVIVVNALGVLSAPPRPFIFIFFIEIKVERLYAGGGLGAHTDKAELILIGFGSYVLEFFFGKQTILFNVYESGADGGAGGGVDAAVAAVTKSGTLAEGLAVRAAVTAAFIASNIV